MVPARMGSTTGLLLLVLTAWMVAPITGYSGGAPPDACTSLTPGHGEQARDHRDITYRIQAAREVTAGSGLEVTLEGTGFLTMAPFMGFLIQVRDTKYSEVVGSFEIGEGVKARYVKCNTVQDTVTHSGPEDKTTVTVVWKSPAEMEGEVYVTATVAQDFSNYWVDFRSGNIAVKPKGLSINAVNFNEESAEAEPEPEPEAEAEPTETSQPQKQRHPVYNGCATIKSCFGLPSGCEDGGGCDVLAAWRQEGEDTEVELFSPKAKGQFTALGISKDSKMGEDLVMSCAEERGTARLGLGWNSGRSNNRLDLDAGMELLEGKVEDGQELYCKFRRANLVEGKAGSTEYMLELGKEQYHVLVATGAYSQTGGLGYHGAGKALASAEKVDMSRVTNVGGRSDLFVKLHGVMMVVAWLGCAGSGMMLARYFKDTWRASSCCGKAHWYQWHRLLMMTVWSLTITGVVLIAVEVGGWPYDKTFIMQNPHPVLGSATLILTFIQPLIALARPHPDASSRWIFNWTHWFIGNSAHVIAIMAMFFAIELDKAKLERVVTWILVAYVVFHTFSHLVLSVNTCWAETKPPSDVHPLSGRQMASIDDLYSTKDKRGGSCRKVCFVSYFLVTWALATLIILLILLDPEALQMSYHQGHLH